MNLWTQQRTARTPDGRSLAIELAGDPDGFPVLRHFGTPNSRHIFGPEAADAASRGLKLICYDRPGYGGSTRQRGRSVADCVTDVRAICAELDITRMATWDGSGGGPHALACGALLPDLVTAAGLLASVAAYPAPGLDWFAGMGDDNVTDFKLTLSDPEAAQVKMENDRLAFLATTAASLKKAFSGFLTPPEEAAFEGETGEYFWHVIQEGLAPGSGGYFDDNMAFTKPWGFEVTGVTVPVLIMQGWQDLMVPPAHGEWLATHVPGAQARFLADEGHLSLLANRMGEVHAWLSEHR